jgi:hypothetical protein
MEYYLMDMPTPMKKQELLDRYGELGKLSSSNILPEETKEVFRKSWNACGDFFSEQCRRKQNQDDPLAKRISNIDIIIKHLGERGIDDKLQMSTSLFSCVLRRNSLSAIWIYGYSIESTESRINYYSRSYEEWNHASPEMEPGEGPALATMDVSACYRPLRRTEIVLDDIGNLPRLGSLAEELAEEPFF